VSASSRNACNFGWRLNFQKGNSFLGTCKDRSEWGLFLALGLKDTCSAKREQSVPSTTRNPMDTGTHRLYDCFHLHNGSRSVSGTAVWIRGSGSGSRTNDIFATTILFKGGMGVVSFVHHSALHATAVASALWSVGLARTLSHTRHFGAVTGPPSPIAQGHAARDSGHLVSPQLYRDDIVEQFLVATQANGALVRLFGPCMECHGNATPTIRQ
jgi:hypothetical protein